MIEAISAMAAALSELQDLASAATAPSSASQIAPEVSGADGASSGTFLQTLQNAVGRVNGAISDADTTTKAFASGDQNIPLSDVMVSLEQANLALQMASGVRDKVVAAYTNIMNMQV